MIVPRSHYFLDNIASVLREREIEEGKKKNAAVVVVRGCSRRITDERRQEEEKEDRGAGGNSEEKEEVMCSIQAGRERGREVGEEDRNNNSLVLSLYSDKFPSRRGVSGHGWGQA